MVTEEAKRAYAEQIHTGWEAEGRTDRGASEVRRWALIAAAIGLGATAAVAIWLLGGADPPDGDGGADAGTDRGAAPALTAMPVDALREEVAAALRTVIAAEDAEAVLAAVRDPDRVGGSVRAWLRAGAGSGASGAELAGVELPRGSSLSSTVDRSVVRVAAEFADGSRRRVSVEWRGGRALVDWEEWVHFQPIPFSAFAEGEAIPAGEEPVFRVTARRVGGFRAADGYEEEAFTCYLLRDPRAYSDEAPAYVGRGSAVEARLESLLQGTLERAVMLRLRKREGGALEIAAFVADGWARVDR